MKNLLAVLGLLFFALAAQAARVIHNTWLYEQLRLKARLFEALASVSRTINSTLNLDDALSVITREACVLMEAKVCSIVMFDESRQWVAQGVNHLDLLSDTAVYRQLREWLKK